MAANIKQRSVPPAKRVLMIAYHFPPAVGSSGIQRTLRFSQYLPDYGWQPIVLAPHARAYPETSKDLMQHVAQGTIVRRAFALDVARHLAFNGRYARAVALPDRWSSWWLGAVPLGLRLIRAFQPQIIWSTSPIATAHVIGWTLQRISGLPWVAELRDPLVHGNAFGDHLVRRANSWVERRIVDAASRVVFVTPGAARLYRSRYTALGQERMSVIENGYDEDSFVRAAAGIAAPRDSSGFTLVHSGILYPGGRDPRALFAALHELNLQGVLHQVGFKLVLRASGMEQRLTAHAAEAGVAQWVQVVPAIPYDAALAEMMSAEGLLLMQGAICNDQIPAKLYEYLRAGRPILALTDDAGDTGRLLRSLGVDTIAPLSSKDDIARALSSFIARARAGCVPIALPERVAFYSRKALTGSFASLLEEVAGMPSVEV